ncbi:hypothetical protein [Dokdonella fugitiva]|jgi:hypothetical protein|uniref:Uncharacterized protein n=1 Tax=Dokdonella fugitiva TaxID=328517 RepID=A0A4R2IC75_9GAMM|nr:hypothetical protein [Dokdonella fugitiva]MBA8885053.1 hypothetical protein [Dokdonella fugitiva]TCO42151.1 hypothetical protein EV148_102510 [Dokdonella fugitiva]
MAKTLAKILLALGVGLMVAGAGAEPAAADYGWPNLADFLQQLIGKVGAPVKVYKLEMDRDGKVDLWIQQQAHPDLVDSWEYDHGRIDGPIPVKFDHYPSVAALDYHVIELTMIDFPRLPAMLATARAKLGLPDARVVYIKLERGDSSGFFSVTDTPIWTFALDGPRHDGRVEFDLKGRVLDVDKD